MSFHCHKRQIYSREEAEANLARARAAAAWDPDRKEVRYYCCWMCSAMAREPRWHLTSEPATGFAYADP